MNTAVEVYLLDTNIASAAFDKGNPNHNGIRERLELIGEGCAYICSVSLGEIEYGLKVAPLIDTERQSVVREAMSQYECWGIDRHSAEAYSNIRATLFKKYSPRNRRGRLTTKRVEDLVEPTTGKELGIDENDLWIVSVAVQYNVVFVTWDQGGGMQRVIEAAEYSPRTEYWGLR